MSIRTKTLLIIGCIVVLVFSGVTFMISQLLFSDANKLEISTLETNLQQVYQAYNVTLEALSTKLSDWAVWDDTFDFIQTKSQKYIDSNLGDTSLENLKIDVMIFMDAKGSVVFDKTHLSATQQNATTSAQLISEMSSLSVGLRNAPAYSDKKGLLLLTEGPFIFSLQPVFHSDKSGPSDGTIMFGQYLNDAMIQTLSETTKLKIELYRMDQPIPAHDAQMLRELQSSKQKSVYFHDSSEAAAYRLLTDTHDKEILLLDVITPRDFYQQSVRSIKLSMGGFIISGVLLLLAIISTLNRLVLTPIITLRREVSEIGSSGELSKRVQAVPSHDEIAGLATDINKMLQSIEEERTTYAQVYMDMVGVLMVVLASDGSIKNINSKGCEILGYSREDLLRKNWFDVCIPEQYRASIHAVFDQLMKGDVQNVETYENSILTHDGKEKIFEWHNGILKDVKGTATGTVSVGQDITDRSLAAEEIKTHASELERINQLMVGRELKMAELKKQVEELQQKIAAKEGV